MILLQQKEKVNMTRCFMVFVLNDTVNVTLMSLLRNVTLMDVKQLYHLSFNLFRYGHPICNKLYDLWFLVDYSW